MALTAQPAAHPNWGRWPQNMPNDFNMMDGQGFLPYDSRGPPHPPPPPPPPQMPQQPQRHMAPQYVVGPPSYNSQPAPPSFTTPQYQAPTTFQYVPYHSPSPTSPVGSPFRSDYHERQLPQAEQGRMIFQRDAKSLHEVQAPSPSARSESRGSTSRCSVSSHPTANAKTITYNETLNPKDRVNFDTDVDELMKAIQRKKSEATLEASQGPTPAHTPRADHTEPSTPSGTTAPAATTGTAAAAETKPKKKWVCDGPSCNKSFVQKTHLDIHRRTHTGAKPYVCTKENCGLTFSQRGNLKTHMRRHTGEKPFSCRICGKTFAQRGNVRSHEETHKGMKPYVCKLDDCNKTFSQLGNMKTHQNNFHKESIKRLTTMFVKLAAEGDIPDEHLELFEYFNEHYKNSNKGVKGRGKARTVAARKPKGQPRSQSLSGPVPQQPLPQIHRHHSLSSYDLTSQSTAPGMASVPRTHHNPEYAMFEQPDVLYADDHGHHHMSFTDRLY
ncbi:hypothetical protein V2A60_004451 [Cordyceps javanica]|uniref:Zinc finger protein OZF n=1 Tax=Cordyceps javanica TaxID=43265 RepID=A0A545VQQ0_9HYPO|nr:zinc finger protein OZF [Cordyceps javanica]TQW04062.1 zinc finger protein OZF [Cordyceps javanica]